METGSWEPCVIWKWSQDSDMETTAGDTSLPLQLTVKHKLTPKLYSDLVLFSQKGRNFARKNYNVFQGLTNQFLNLDFEGELSLGIVAGLLQSLVARSLTADECLEWTDGEVLICKWPPEDRESFFTGDSLPILVLVT